MRAENDPKRMSAQPPKPLRGLVTSAGLRRAAVTARHELNNRCYRHLPHMLRACV